MGMKNSNTKSILMRVLVLIMLGAALAHVGASTITATDKDLPEEVMKAIPEDVLRAIPEDVRIMLAASLYNIGSSPITAIPDKAISEDILKNMSAEVLKVIPEDVLAPFKEVT